MNLSGIRTSSVFYDYNQIKNDSLQSQKIQQQSLEESGGANQIDSSEKESKPDYGAADYAKRYQPDATYELKGMDSDISNLDVQKFMSDLKKDEVLQQYQFFVGDSVMQTGVWQSRENENFSL